MGESIKKLITDCPKCGREEIHGLYLKENRKREVWFDKKFDLMNARDKGSGGYTVHCSCGEERPEYLHTLMKIYGKSLKKVWRFLINERARLLENF